MIWINIFSTPMRSFRGELGELTAVLPIMPIKGGIKLTVFAPAYEKYGRAAPIVRNRQIVEYSDRIIAFWDGSSRTTLSVIRYAKRIGKPCEVILYKG